MERRGSERTAHPRIDALKGVVISLTGKSVMEDEPDSTAKLRPSG